MAVTCTILGPAVEGVAVGSPPTINMKYTGVLIGAVGYLATSSIPKARYGSRHLP
jgi:hypothetical protein